MQRKLLEIIRVDFDVTGQLLGVFYTFVKYLRKNVETIRHCIIYLQTSRQPVIQLGRRPCVIFPLSLVSP
jgi:hypothetical protein